MTGNGTYFPGVRRQRRLMRFGTILILILLAYSRCLYAEEPPQPVHQKESAETTFSISAFYFSGNTLYTDEELRNVVASFVGPGKTAADVEKARDAVEKFYHEEGYPAVLVNIPEQTIGGEVVTLQVIENRIGKVTVTGNRYFPTDTILRELPSLAPGEILYVPDLRSDLANLNKNPDLKVSPTIVPGKEVGFIDVELKADDELPLHGSLELNNRYSPNTTDLRLIAALRYDNLWHEGHSLAAQFQVSPENTNEVQVYSGSYTLPLPWDRDQRFILYGVRSNSNTLSKEFNVAGKGDIIGGRYVVPLPTNDYLSHNLVFGFDYKKFDDTLGFAPTGSSDTGSSDLKTPITYLPASINYGASLSDDSGVTQLNATLNFAFRGLVTNQREFEEKRFRGQGNYLYLTLGCERTQKLRAGMGLFLKLDGQLSDEPLITNEQYAAGGMESVRGYRESEVTGDNALHGMVEFSAPNLAEPFGLGPRFLISPYVFYDFAALETLKAQAGQAANSFIHGTGVGVRGYLFRSVEYETDWGFALKNFAQIEKGASRIYFKLKYQF